jgi:hypothetical protein
MVQVQVTISLFVWLLQQPLVKLIKRHVKAIRVIILDCIVSEVHAAISIAWCKIGVRLHELWLRGLVHAWPSGIGGVVV